MLLYNLWIMSSRWCCSYNIQNSFEWETPSCMCLFMCACYYWKKHAKGQWYRLHKALEPLYGWTFYLLLFYKKLVNLFSRGNPPVYTTHTRHPWYSVMIPLMSHDYLWHQCSPYVCWSTTLPLWIMYVCMYMKKAESYIKLKHHERILWYYLKAPFSQQMLYLWCDLLTSMAVASNPEYREEQLAHSRLLVNMTVQSVQQIR